MSPTVDNFTKGLHDNLEAIALEAIAARLDALAAAANPEK